MTHQLNFVFQESDWVCPSEYPDLSHADAIAIDLETKDPNLKTLGPGWPRFDGAIVGFAVATAGQQYYFPIHMMQEVIWIWLLPQLTCKIY